MIALSIGGSPRDPENLWPQLRKGEWNAHMKDALEMKLHRRVCEGRTTLAEAQTAMQTDWIAAYHKYTSKGR